MMEWLQEFGEWAWARHANVWSWYIRPLFLIPFVFFAYRRSWKGIAVTMVALATSMFWFPAPAEPDPQVVAFLDAEREYLTGDWTLGKVALTSLVPLSLWALAAAFWRRSLVWGLVVLNAIAVVKTLWSVVYDEGGVAVIAPALAGLVVTNAAVLAGAWWVRRRRHLQDQPRVGEHEDRVHQPTVG
jgi:hypothetical protein